MKNEVGLLETLAQYKTENQFVENKKKCFEMNLKGYQRPSSRLQKKIDDKLGIIFMH